MGSHFLGLIAHWNLALQKNELYLIFWIELVPSHAFKMYLPISMVTYSTFPSQLSFSK